ncbi:MAG: response regulator transcription factor [Streptosporangiaceae bacterium]
MSAPVRLLLAEDQVMIREALAALLSFEDDMEVVTQVGRGDEVAKAARDTNPDVALLDIEMPGLADGLNPLTPRERVVLEASAGGGTIAEIARQLHLSEGTVRNYLSACIQKTGARNRAEALRIASDRGWL